MTQNVADTNAGRPSSCDSAWTRRSVKQGFSGPLSEFGPQLTTELPPVRSGTDSASASHCAACTPFSPIPPSPNYAPEKCSRSGSVGTSVRTERDARSNSPSDASNGEFTVRLRVPLKQWQRASARSTPKLASTTLHTGGRWSRDQRTMPFLAEARGHDRGQLTSSKTGQTNA